MPYYHKHTRGHIQLVIKKLREKRYKKVAELKAAAWITEEPVNFTERTTGKKKEIGIGEKWGNLWDCAWFNFTGQVPREYAGEKIVLLIDVSGEGCVFDKNGVPIRGLTTVSSRFDFSLGEPGKRVVQFLDEAVGGEEIDIWLDAGNNDLFGKYKNNGRLEEASIAVCNEDIRKLYYDFVLLYELMDNISEDKARHFSLLEALREAANLLIDYNSEEVRQAREVLAGELNKKGGDSSLKISALGHAHIDLAWLWPIRETIRKGARTFSTVLEMMDRYPDYRFGASQPQLYLWMKDNYPELYSKIKEKVAEGRWEAQGAMWVEADTNISGGEALVRQILYGKKFFKEEFDKEIDILWLPDVFGYSGSLPQIMKKAGVDYFMTQKLSWNEHNDFPHHTFFWEGIDGSRVLTHMLPEETYNSPGSPRAVLKAERNFHEKGISDNCLLLYGIGDGGGGPGAEHLEMLKREKNLAGMPPVEQEFSTDFFKHIEKDADKYKAWSGELYLEKHQGTFTTQARNKRYNRKMELALRELEYAATIAMLTSDDFVYPQEEIETIWKEVLLYQFHDILPGSSIKRVYDESLERYWKLFARTYEMVEEAYTSLIGINKSEDMPVYTVFNSLSWDRREWIKVDDLWYHLEINALDSAVIKIGDTASTDSGTIIATNYNHTDSSFEEISDLKADNGLLENDLLKIVFSEDGTINSIYDKEAGREVLEPEGTGNCLAVYDDQGDAWDIEIYYEEKQAEAFEIISTEEYIDGPRAVMKNVYKYGDSTLEQEVSISSGSKRVDFETIVDWHERHKMLRTSFPLNVFAREAVCDIQFGTVKRPTHRNTSWDMAKFEVPAQKWVDLSQADYGAALLNDCKYGYKVRDNDLDLNLLRSTAEPDVDADQGKHQFAYSLYPHIGDYQEGKVAREAYNLNIPLQMFSGETVVDSSSLIQVEDDNIIVESIKKAEDNEDIIIRLYENEGKTTETEIYFNLNNRKIEAVSTANLMEEVENELVVDDNRSKIKFQPFAINTLRLSWS